MMLVNDVLFALGLAFESFVVAMANGLNGAGTRFKRMLIYATLFAGAHAAALWIGYVTVVSVRSGLNVAEETLTWFAVAALAFIGAKTLIGGIRELRGEKPKGTCNIAEAAVQSVAAALDAFAVGLTVPEYSVAETAICSVLFFFVIAVFYIVGYFSGKKFGEKIGRFAGLLGGAVFIGLAVELAVGALI